MREGKMSLGEQMAELLISSGTAWSTSMLAKHFNVTCNNVTNALASTRRHCMLTQKRKPSRVGTPQYYYSAMVGEGCGLLYSPKPPPIRVTPSVLNQPFHPKND